MIYRCVRDGTVSLATAPEPGSEVHGADGGRQRREAAQPVGNQRHPEGHVVRAPAGRQDRLQHPQPARLHARPGLLGNAAARRAGARGPGPRRQAAGPRCTRSCSRPPRKANKIDDAWLRAIAHAESDFQADAVSPKGAQGIMQMLPATSRRISGQGSVLAGAVDPGRREVPGRAAAPLQRRSPTGRRGLQRRHRHGRPLRRNSALRRNPGLCRQGGCAVRACTAPRCPPAKAASTRGYSRGSSIWFSFRETTRAYKEGPSLRPPSMDEHHTCRCSMMHRPRPPRRATAST